MAKLICHNLACQESFWGRTGRLTCCTDCDYDYHDWREGERNKEVSASVRRRLQSISMRFCMIGLSKWQPNQGVSNEI